ncbi:MAG: hypothetical protein ED859_16050 [Desulfuromonadales bacterium]|nr:MAG: hypothetical protein ED859_16050 [Desulfuromonadales bacterium]
MKGSIVLVALLFLSASPVVAGEAAFSPAEQRIAWARKAIEANPKDHQAYNELAMAFARRARETSDTAFYDRAGEALKESFLIAPGNFEGRKTRVWVLLGRHEFAQALEEARKLNRDAPDDLMVYGFLVDANAELGNYREAEEAAQWMLDLRPGNIPGLTRAAYLRELFGDIDGAVELLDTAYRRTPPTETEDRAWLLTHVAHLRLSIGKMDEAEKLLDAALALFPGYHYALANRAKVRTAQRRYPEAVELLQKRYRAAPHPENLFVLAEALELAGRGKESKAAFTEFEKKARQEMNGADNANRELIFFYTDHAQRPDEALRIARVEIARRRDVHTLDACAWALSATGSHAEARRQIETALAVGVLDAKILYHAAVITFRTNDRKAALRHLQRSLELNPSSEVADSARKMLARLQRTGEKRKRT